MQLNKSQGYACKKNKVFIQIFEKIESDKNIPRKGNKKSLKEDFKGRWCRLSDSN